MELLKAILILVIGFVLLIKGADFFVEGSSSVAKKFHVPAMLIGMTIVAMGTSLPECAVSVTASLANNNSLAVSNVIGSNIFNLMVVCGACALFSPLTIRQDTLKKEFPLSIICAALMLVLGYIGMTLGHIDGIIFLVLFVGYLLWMIQSAKKARAAVLSDPAQSGQIEQTEFVEENIAILPTWKSLVFIIGGMIAIKFGGDFVVNGASSIASSMGLSQTLIGLTIVAMGTSLPELVTSLVAAKKGEVDMALGNVIGSDIFNILFVLGIATAISPISFLMENVIDIILLIIMSVIVLAFAWTKQQINRKEGILMLLMYAAYMVYICVR
ncbi:k+-dependent Na+/Ca+ exchanger family protein [Dorea sp. CAG:105]|nr:k+-dependent Na+/Ca+ exchanger family protein [Dorea sp. CAG:105]